MVFFFKQKTAYELRISDWSSDVCSSDLAGKAQEFADEAAGARQSDRRHGEQQEEQRIGRHVHREAAIAADLARVQPVIDHADAEEEIGRASCRERVCQYV